jgi:hypothetical protein
MRKFKVSSFLGDCFGPISNEDDWETHIMDEDELKSLANYYNKHADIPADVDFRLGTVESAIEFVSDIDVVFEDTSLTQRLTLKQFLKHMESTREELLEDLYRGKGISKYDVTIQLNGKYVVIPLHADCYSRLERLIQEEIEEENELR